MILTDAMPVSPTVVPGVRSLRRSPPPAGVTAGVPVAGVPLTRAAASTNFLLAVVSVEMAAMSARMADVSCWSMAVSFVAVSARLSSAVSNRPIAGAAAGITP